MNEIKGNEENTLDYFGYTKEELDRYEKAITKKLNLQKQQKPKNAQSDYSTKEIGLEK